MFKIGEKVRLKRYEDLISDHCIPIATLKKWCGKIVTIKGTSNTDDLNWYHIKEGTYGWGEDMFLGRVVGRNLEYTFRDKVDIHQLCADSLEDDLNSFLVVGNGMAIIGVLGGGIQIDAEGKKLTMETAGYPYNMAEIDLEDVGFWRKKLIQYSKDYKVWRAELDAHIKDRDRIKLSAHKFKVMGF